MASPPLGVKPGRYVPGALHREILVEQLVFFEESVRDCPACSRGLAVSIWVVVKIMVPFWVP